MLFVDNREGSHDLVAPLVKIGLPVHETRLDPAGDLYWVGRGEHGKGLNVGIEYKHLSELIGSLRTNRLQGHQLQEMRAVDENGKPFYDVAYLIVEGEMAYDDRGQLQRHTSRQTFKPLGMSVAEMLKRLAVMHLCAGLTPIWTRNQRDTVQWINALYHVWTDKDLDEHRSHLALYEPPTLAPISGFARTVRTLPGVGLAFAEAAQQQFKTIRRAINASAKEWAAVETESDGKRKRLGLTKATKIVEYVTT